MTKKSQADADYEAELEAEKAAEKKYPTKAKAVEVEMPERFSNGGATADEKAAWLAENRPEPLVETAKCGPPDEA